MKQRLYILLAFALSVLSVPGRADSWLPPQPETYLSPDKDHRLRIIPRALSSPLAYFSDKVEGKEPAGAPRGSKQILARAIVERLNVDGRWTTVWDTTLTNEVAPVVALISDGGQYVVTFDNWHSVGYGANVVAIHDRQGQLIRKMALSDLLSADYIAALSHSVSSIHWRGNPRLTEDGNLSIPIVVPHNDDPSDKEIYIDAIIRLADGKVLSGSSPDWQKAIAFAQSVAAQKREYAEQSKRAFINPLLGPAANTERGWHDYLSEAFYRTASDWKDNVPASTVLRDPKDEEYAASEGWLRENLLALDYPKDAIAIASIAPFDYLVERMKAILADAKPGKLKGVRLYIVAPSTALPMLKAMFAPTGAKVICLDPTQPIPQRPERLKRFRSSDRSISAAGFRLVR